jgi:hypothetical protein
MATESNQRSELPPPSGRPPQRVGAPLLPPGIWPAPRPYPAAGNVQGRRRSTTGRLLTVFGVAGGVVVMAAGAIALLAAIAGTGQKSTVRVGGGVVPAATTPSTSVRQTSVVTKPATSLVAKAAASTSVVTHAPTTVVLTTSAPSTKVTVPPSTVPPTTVPPTTAPPTPVPPTPFPPTSPPKTTVASVVLAAPSEPCEPSYDPCIPPGPDVDCAGGKGNGPRYVKGPIVVRQPDPYDLDRDKDGIGCE